MICFIQQGHSGPINIGYTQEDPKVRLLSLEKASPQKLRLLGSIEGTPEKEAQLHNFFQTYRLNGEWFSPEPKFLYCVLTLLLNKELLIESVEEIKYPSLSVGTLGDERAKVIEKFERDYITNLLESTKGSINKSAQIAGITTRQLHKLMTKYHIIKEIYKYRLYEK